MRVFISSLFAAAFSTLLAFQPAQADAIGGANEPINWAGAYWGVSGGVGWGKTEFYNNWGGTSGNYDRHGGLLGVTGGYNWQLGSVVLGAEADISLSTIKASTTSGACATGCSTDLNWLGTLRGRVGYPVGKFMPYATGGLAVGSIETKATPIGNTETKYGWTAGAGLAYAFTTGFSAKAEYLYTDLGNTKLRFLGTTGTTKADNYQIFRVGLNFAF